MTVPAPVVVSPDLPFLPPVTLDGVRMGHYSGEAVETRQGRPVVEWLVTKLDGWHDAPAPDPQRTNRVNAHGVHSGRSWRRGRVLTLEGVATAVDEAELDRVRRRIKGFCADTSHAEAYRLSVDEASGRLHANVELDDEIDIEPHTWCSCTFSVQLFAQDPRLLGDTIVAETPLPSRGEGGIRSKLGHGISSKKPGIHAGGWKSTGYAYVNNSGTAPTYPVLEIQGPVPAKATVKCDQTGQWFEYLDAIDQGRSIWINTSSAPQLGIPGKGVFADKTVSRHHRLVAHGGWPEVAPNSTFGFKFDIPKDYPEKPPPEARLRIHYSTAWW